MKILLIHVQYGRKLQKQKTKLNEFFTVTLDKKKNITIVD